MELRDLRAFVSAARELHFARAAERSSMSPSSMSELIGKLERELGTPLFIRTTRRITLTDAGAELLARAETILELVEQAIDAVHATTDGRAGQLRIGLTPPAAPVLGPHLIDAFAAASPGVSVDTRRMWLPSLVAELLAGTIDFALTCGGLGIQTPTITTIEVGAEPLLIGLRPDHPLAGAAGIDLRQLGDLTLGMHPAHLFPAWHAAQSQILIAAELSPPIVELRDADLSARHWSDQPEVDWIMLIGSLLGGHDASAVVATLPRHLVPFTLSWQSAPAPRPVVQRFLAAARDAPLPPGWMPAEAAMRWSQRRVG